MGQIRRPGLTTEQKTELWDRWQRGESLKAIGRAFGKPSSSIYCLVSPHGGIRPVARRRSRLALTLSEREEISRGLVARRSIRSIARELCRSPSTVSREIGRNGGRTRYRAARAEAQTFDEAFWSGEPLEQLFDQIGPSPSGRSERIFAAGMTEWRRSHKNDGGMIGGAQVRIDRSMDVAIQKEAEDLQKGLPLLATIGSTAPFVGLFGTVIGIMNAFIEIGQQQSTNLAVVAPGIAEALLATGLGLLAAVPAVIFYNKLSADSDRIIAGYESFADEFATILSRQLDQS